MEVAKMVHDNAYTGSPGWGVCIANKHYVFHLATYHLRLIDYYEFLYLLPRTLTWHL